MRFALVLLLVLMSSVVAAEGKCDAVPGSWKLDGPFTVEQVERQVDPRNARWTKVKEKYQSGDQIWRFNEGHMKGFALIRNMCMIDFVITTVV